MTEFECYAVETRTIERSIDARDRTDAAKRFRTTYKLWPESVGNDVCMGGCEVCHQAVFEDEPSLYTADNVLLHERCIPEDMRDAKG